MRRCRSARLVLSFLAFLTCRAGAATVESAHYVMGTVLTIRVEAAEEAKARLAADAMFAEVDRQDAKLSHYKPASELSQINAAAGRAPVAVSSDTYDAIATSVDFARRSNGLFDPTIGALTHAWRFDAAQPALPDSRTSAQAKDLVDYRKVVLDRAATTVFLAKPGMRLDLGGIGKGIALDRALERALVEPSVSAVWMDFGGQLLFWRRQPWDQPETVAVEGTAEWFALRANGSVATSSNLERSLTVGATTYGHLFDPKTGRPTASKSSVTVLAPTATEADAWSTIVFVAGPDRASDMLRKESRIQMLVIVRGEDGRERRVASRGWPATSPPR